MTLLDFSLGIGEDATLSFAMSPPTGIGGRNLQFLIQKELGGLSGIYLASVNSGFNGLSGITITDSGQGRASITIPSLCTSGLDPVNFSYKISFQDYPVTSLTEGFVLLNP